MSIAEESVQSEPYSKSIPTVQQILSWLDEGDDGNDNGGGTSVEEGGHGWEAGDDRGMYALVDRKTSEVTVCIFDERDGMTRRMKSTPWGLRRTWTPIHDSSDVLYTDYPSLDSDKNLTS